MIAAKNHWCLTFDNLSYIPAALSDALCRLATGAGLSTRKLYTDEEEILFESLRPIILNGIDVLATRGDLLDRTIVICLPRIETHLRQREEAFWQDFDKVRPRITGALYSAVSLALRRLPDVQISNLPRMADFAMFAYSRNRRDSTATTLEDSSLVGALIKFLNQCEVWEGRASDLLVELDSIVSEDKRRGKEWPKAANALTNKLRRLAPSLSNIGIFVLIKRSNKGSLVSLAVMSNTDDNVTEIY